MENQLPQNHFRTFVSIYEVEWNGQPRRAVLPRTCNHCDNPPCVRNCPTQATYKDKTGIVLVNNTVCIGCGYCIQTCPYDARYINPDSHTTDKCTFCLHRLNAGLLPACVETCVGGARVFGDLTDPNSQVSQLLKENAVRVMKPDLNTLPRVYYIAMDEYGKVGLDRSGSPKSEISASAKGKVLNG
jgi:tetrathionate reductase subunit B